MTLKLQLSEEDRERLGAPEWLDCATNPLRVREAEAMEDATSLSTAEALRAMEPQITVLPDAMTLRYHYSAKGLRLRVWLGLYRLGNPPDWATLDFDAGQFLVSHEQAVVPEGKEPGSPTAEPSTKSTSRSTGRTRSRKSATST